MADNRQDPDLIRSILQQTGFTPVASDDAAPVDIMTRGLGLIAPDDEEPLIKTALRTDGPIVPQFEPEVLKARQERGTDGTMPVSFAPAFAANVDPVTLQTLAEIKTALIRDREDLLVRKASLTASDAPLLSTEEDDAPSNDVFGTDSFKTANRNVANLQEQGGAAIGGRAVINPSLETPEQKRERERGDLDFALMIADQIRRIDEELAEIEKQINECENALAALDAENPRLIAERKEIAGRIKGIEKREAELQTDIQSTESGEKSVDRDIDRLIAGLSPQLKTEYDALKKAGESVVTVRYNFPGDRGGQNYHVVYKDEKGDYYIKGPQGNEVYIKDIPGKRGERMMEKIREQEARGEAFGNQNPEAAAAYNSQYQRWIQMQKDMGFRDELVGLLDRRDELRARGRDLRTELKDLRTEKAELQERLRGIEGKLGDTPEERAALEKLKALEIRQTELLAKKEALERDRTALKADMGQFFQTQRTKHGQEARPSGANGALNTVAEQHASHLTGAQWGKDLTGQFNNAALQQVVNALTQIFNPNNPFRPT